MPIVDNRQVFWNMIYEWLDLMQSNAQRKKELEFFAQVLNDYQTDYTTKAMYSDQSLFVFHPKESVLLAITKAQVTKSNIDLSFIDEDSVKNIQIDDEDLLENHRKKMTEEIASRKEGFRNELAFQIANHNSELEKELNQNKEKLSELFKNSNLGLVVNSNFLKGIHNSLELKANFVDNPVYGNLLPDTLKQQIIHASQKYEAETQKILVEYTRNDSFDYDGLIVKYDTTPGVSGDESDNYHKKWADIVNTEIHLSEKDTELIQKLRKDYQNKFLEFKKQAQNMNHDEALGLYFDMLYPNLGEYAKKNQGKIFEAIEKFNQSPDAERLSEKDIMALYWLKAKGKLEDEEKKKLDSIFFEKDSSSIEKYLNTKEKEDGFKKNNADKKGFEHDFETLLEKYHPLTKEETERLNTPGKDNKSPLTQSLFGIDKETVKTYNFQQKLRIVNQEKETIFSSVINSMVNDKRIADFVRHHPSFMQCKHIILKKESAFFRNYPEADISTILRHGVGTVNARHLAKAQDLYCNPDKETQKIIDENQKRTEKEINVLREKLGLTRYEPQQTQDKVAEAKIEKEDILKNQNYQDYKKEIGDNDEIVRPAYKGDPDKETENTYKKTETNAKETVVTDNLTGQKKAAVEINTRHEKVLVDKDSYNTIMGKVSAYSQKINENSTDKEKIATVASAVKNHELNEITAFIVLNNAGVVPLNSMVREGKEKFQEYVSAKVSLIGEYAKTNQYSKIRLLKEIKDAKTVSKDGSLSEAKNEYFPVVAEAYDKAKELVTNPNKDNLKKYLGDESIPENERMAMLVLEQRLAEDKDNTLYSKLVGAREIQITEINKDLNDIDYACKEAEARAEKLMAQEEKLHKAYNKDLQGLGVKTQEDISLEEQKHLIQEQFNATPKQETIDKYNKVKDEFEKKHSDVELPFENPQTRGEYSVNYGVMTDRASYFDNYYNEEIKPEQDAIKASQIQTYQASQDAQIQLELTPTKSDE